jgi:hypothetical protein
MLRFGCQLLSSQPVADVGSYTWTAYYQHDGTLSDVSCGRGDDFTAIPNCIGESLLNTFNVDAWAHQHIGGGSYDDDFDSIKSGRVVATFLPSQHPIPNTS